MQTLDWGAAAINILVLGALILGMHKYGTDRRSPQYPWEKLGSAAQVNVINETDDTVNVWAQAPEIDNATRLMGKVLPYDSTTLRSPYADTKVIITAGSISKIINMNKPATWRLVIE